MDPVNQQKVKAGPSNCSGIDSDDSSTDNIFELNSRDCDYGDDVQRVGRSNQPSGSVSSRIGVES